MTSVPPELTPLAPDTVRRLRELAVRWTDVGAAERANYQLYLIELCSAIGVEGPRPAAVGGRVAEGIAYQFEFPVQTTTRDGTVSTNFIDLYKSGCFALEAKDAVDGSSTGKLLTKAFGQVANYARDLSERPPYIIVLDVGKSMIIWDRWSGSYGGFHLGQRIDLRALTENAEHVALLRDIWNDPTVRDPRRYAQAITVEIAGLLAELASTLEARGHDPERVARFLIRCVFSMFAEDVKLLPDKAFTRLLDAVMPSGPDAFVQAAHTLWRAMDSGEMFGYHRLLRFNGHFFAQAEALPLERAEVELLRRASAADWSAVEPSIFGTLLVRALSAEERHRLGAEYTPRAFIERLVRPTVEEPVRERWTAVQAEVMQLRERGRAVDVRLAVTRLTEFHAWLRGLQILDPACGSGNFLYVTMHALKRVEVEVFRLLAETQGGQLGVRLAEIDPSQFHGIEVKAWAREIAELTLWIGFYQFWRQQHGDVQPDEPLLRDTGTLEHRDAVLAWDSIRHVPEKDRLDPTPRIVHPVTGQLVPDPTKKLKYYEYVGARQAEWPQANFIVGNPPYLGRHRKRDALGDGYVDAISAAYPTMNDSVDFVMYWWWIAAERVAKGATIRAGLITTNSIVQGFNAEIVRGAVGRGVRIVWAAPDHPWTDGSDDADVRVAMTVIELGNASQADAIRVDVDDSAAIINVVSVPRLNADLSAFADVDGAATVALRANGGLAMRGVQPQGAGFQLEAAEGERLRVDDRNRAVVRHHRNGRDLAARARGRYIVDFALLSEADARSYPGPFNLVLDRVKPERLANSRAAYARYWWRLGEPRPGLRAALAPISRFVVTPETTAHRFFTFLESTISIDNSVVAIACDIGFLLGSLSSRIHLLWATAAGTRLGVGNDSRYNNPRCFDAFPFPDPPPALRAQIAALAESLDAHRKSAIDRDVRVTMTGMYNVVAKLRTNEPLTPKERAVHEIAACGVLRDMHDELDALVAEAYGWPWPMPDTEILDRLVALHDARVAEEAQGHIRWLRPEYQAPNRQASAVPVELALIAGDATVPSTVIATLWPAEAIEQIGALKRLASSGPLTVDSAAAHFTGARRDIVARHLETLAILGELRELPSGHFGPSSLA